MAIIMRYLPAYGLAVYDTPDPSAPDNAPMIAPGSHTDKVKFHSNFEYLTVGTPLDVSVSLPACAATEAVVPGGSTIYPGNYQSGIINVYAHGRSSIPYFNGMLVNYSGANRPLRGTLILDKPNGGLFNSAAPFNSRLFRSIQLAVDETHIRLIWRAYISSGSSRTQSGPSFSGNPYPAVTLTVRLWLFDWNLDGALGSYNASLPMLSLTATDIKVGRGKFDTTNEYIRTGTGTNNNLMTTGETMTITGSGAAPWQSPPWGWRYSVDTTTIEGQGPASSFAATFTRVKLP